MCITFLLGLFGALWGLHVQHNSTASTRAQDLVCKKDKLKGPDPAQQVMGHRIYGYFWVMHQKPLLFPPQKSKIMTNFGKPLISLKSRQRNSNATMHSCYFSDTPDDYFGNPKKNIYLILRNSLKFNVCCGKCVKEQASKLKTVEVDMDEKVHHIACVRSSHDIS